MFENYSLRNYLQNTANHAITAAANKAESSKGKGKGKGKSSQVADLSSGIPEEQQQAYKCLVGIWKLTARTLDHQVYYAKSLTEFKLKLYAVLDDMEASSIDTMPSLVEAMLLLEDSPVEMRRTTIRSMNLVSEEN